MLKMHFSTTCTVSGDANFTMERTGFTVGGFTQPGVAKGLIENPSNIEKGLCQRFLWLVPRPSPVPFAQLQPVQKEFCASLGECLCDCERTNTAVSKGLRTCSLIIAKKPTNHSLTTWTIFVTHDNVCVRACCD